jgi:chorismate mutase
MSETYDVTTIAGWLKEIDGLCLDTVEERAQAAHHIVDRMKAAEAEQARRQSQEAQR